METPSCKCFLFLIIFLFVVCSVYFGRGCRCLRALYDINHFSLQIDPLSKQIGIKHNFKTRNFGLNFSLLFFFHWKWIFWNIFFFTSMSVLDNKKYIILVVLLILIQLIGTAIILLDPHWTDVRLFFLKFNNFGSNEFWSEFLYLGNSSWQNRVLTWGV